MVVIVLTGPLCISGSVMYMEEMEHFPAFAILVELLLGRTHVGIWSRMATSEVQDIVQCMLPDDIVSRLCFVLGGESAGNWDPHPDRQQFFRELFCKNSMRNLLSDHIVVFIDVDPLNPQLVSIIHPRVRILAINV